MKLKNINGYVIDEETGTLIDTPKNLKVYNIPREVKQFVHKAVENMVFANEINFKNSSIEKIPNECFFYIDLKKITLPNGIKYLGDNCFDPTKVECNYPITLEHLGKNMYPESQELIIGKNIKSLGDGFANSDKYLEYVEVFGAIKKLPNEFVKNCCNLKILILHEGIEQAGNKAFRGLNSLEYVELPNSFKQPFKMERHIYFKL